MIINSGTIREAFQSFNTVFNKAFHKMEAQYPRVAMEVPSETRDENYAWLGAVPSMREWIGDREIKNLAAYGYTIRNKDFEATVTVPGTIWRMTASASTSLCSRIWPTVPGSTGQAGVRPVPPFFYGEVFRWQAFISDDHTLPLLDIRPRRKVTKELTNLYGKLIFRGMTCRDFSIQSQQRSSFLNDPYCSMEWIEME